MSQLSKKLSTAKIYGKIVARTLPEDGSVKPLYTIIGVAQGVKEGTSDYGDWVGLLGQFEAVNRDTGERFASANVFLPDVAQDLIVAQLRSGAQNVQFAFTIGARVDDSSTVGYTYTAEPILAPDQKDPLEELRQSAFAALPAPEKAEGKKAAKK